MAESITLLVLLSVLKEAGTPGVRGVSDVRTALACLPAPVAILTGGVVFDLRAAAAVATGAAVVLGFAAFKRLRGSPAPAMAAVTTAVVIGAVVGTLAGQFDAAIVAAVIVWGFASAVLGAADATLGWIGQQATIVLMVASAFPGSVEQALTRAGLILAGSAAQFVCFETIRRLTGPTGPVPTVPEAWASARGIWADLRAALRPDAAVASRAVSLALVLAATVEGWRVLRLPNGYWMAMTVLLLTKPDFRGTAARAAERILGTVAGAALATAITAGLAPFSSPWVLAALTAVFAGLTLSAQQGNAIAGRRLNFPGSYALFAVVLTAYVVLLLDFGGLQPSVVAANRILLTFFGGVFALSVHLLLVVSRQFSLPARRAPSTG